MYDINLSTLLLIGIDEENTKIISYDEEIMVNESAKKIIDNSCRYFGSSLNERVLMTGRYTNMKSKVPIIIEETKNLIFFPLKSVRENCNTWISFNNLVKYEKNGKNTDLYFNNNVVININCSYYIIDNQITRCMLLDYSINKRRKSLEK